MNSESRKIKIVEVGLRDGLQNESRILSVQQRVLLAQALLKCEFAEIEVGSLVKADKVPAMKDSDLVFLELAKSSNLNTPMSLLVPNLKGLERALKIGVKHISIFTSASNAFNLKNTGVSVADSLLKYQELVREAKRNNLSVRGYLSTAFYCPFTQKISPKTVWPILEELLNMGCHEVSLGDTIGRAQPQDVNELLAELKPRVAFSHLALHFHDTFGLALSNVVAALTHGIDTFDSSLLGWGGCPFAPGAKGNLNTRQLVEYLKNHNKATTVALKLLSEAEELGRRFLEASPCPS